MKQQDILFPRMEDLADRATKIGCAASRFLTPAEAQGVVGRFAKRRDVKLVLDGGYEGAERVRGIFLDDACGEYDPSKLFCALKIWVPPQESIGHRDVLGAIMALGIDRSAIGDIIESPLTLICLPELGGFVTENLTKAGRADIRLSPMELSEIPPRFESLTVKADTVASLRLDAVLGTAFGLSRSKGLELIKAGRAYLNHEVCLQSAKEVSEGMIISLRGMGRAKLLEIGGTSKKGRIFIKVGLYK